MEGKVSFVHVFQWCTFLFISHFAFLISHSQSP